jgi:hypothetical protein
VLPGQVEQVEQDALVADPLLEMLDGKCSGSVEMRDCVLTNAWRLEALGPGPRTPDIDEVALARSRRTDDRSDRGRPGRPSVDHRYGGPVAAADEKVLSPKR